MKMQMADLYHRATPSCQRCRQRGIECEGYGVRLNWKHYNASGDHSDESAHELDDGESIASRARSRRSITYIGVSDIPRIPSPEIDNALDQIEHWSAQKSPSRSPRLQRAGFAVFPIDLPPTPFSEDDAEPGLPLNDRPVNRLDALRTHTTEFLPTPPDSTSCPTLTLPQTPFSLRRQSDTPPQRTSQKEDEAPQLQTESRPGASLTHLDVLQMPSTQKRLVHHWVTFTSRKITLLDEPHNPCRTMMLPMALQGLISSSQESNPSVVVFHALCAAASCNLFELGGRKNEQDRLVALYHDEQAIKHLRDNLSRADEHTDQSFAMAIMACIMVDAISGTTQRWRTHVSGGLAYLAKLRSRGVDETMLAAFQRHMVSMAILCDVSVADELKSFLDAQQPLDPLETTFPYYGVSRAFLQAHDKMNQLSTLPPPALSAMEKELDAFEMQLYLNFPTPPAQLMAAPTDPQGLILHHIAKVFYYAHLVFFQRSIRHASLASVQTLVDLGIREVEAIEKVGRGNLGCMMLWPVLVLGAECAPPLDDQGTGLRHRMKSWFKEQSKLGFRNLVVLENLIEAVWDAQQDSADWRDLIAEPEFDVFRL